jgi:hypothetical protein
MCAAISRASTLWALEIMKEWKVFTSSDVQCLQSQQLEAMLGGSLAAMVGVK